MLGMATTGAGRPRPPERAPISSGTAEVRDLRGPGPRALREARNVPTKFAIVVMTTVIATLSIRFAQLFAHVCSNFVPTSAPTPIPGGATPGIGEKRP